MAERQRTKHQSQNRTERKSIHEEPLQMVVFLSTRCSPPIILDPLNLQYNYRNGITGIDGSL